MLLTTAYYSPATVYGLTESIFYVFTFLYFLPAPLFISPSLADDQSPDSVMPIYNPFNRNLHPTQWQGINSPANADHQNKIPLLQNVCFMSAITQFLLRRFFFFISLLLCCLFFFLPAHIFQVILLLLISVSSYFFSLPDSSPPSSFSPLELASEAALVFQDPLRLMDKYFPLIFQSRI